MSGTYKFVRLVGTSHTGYEDAISKAIADARKSLHHINWFQVIEQRGHVDPDGKVNEWQVVIDVAFKIDNSD